MKNPIRLLTMRSKYMPGFGDMLTGGTQLMGFVIPMMKAAARGGKKLDTSRYATSFAEIDKEKEEILNRANWLCDKIIVSPDELLYSYPKILGPYYGPQWSIYSCVNLIAALANISHIWPETKGKCLSRMEKLLVLLQSEQLKRYDASEWGEDPIETLEGNKSHVTYLSILAWGISLYRLAGGSDKYDDLYGRCCEAMNRRMLRHKDMNLLSFPNKPVFFPDMFAAIVALKNYSLLFDDRYEDTIRKYLDKVRQKWLNYKTGLIVAMLYGQRKTGIRGCYVGMNNFWLTLIDDEFAFDQYSRMKRILYKKDKFAGIKEYTYKSPKIAFDPDAGPIIDGLSPSGTAFAIGSATYFKDWDVRNSMLATADLVGGRVEGDRQLHYKLGEFALVGEATVLAMRTNFPEVKKKMSMYKDNKTSSLL